jgi:crossover junction endodeoxyribonuclease RuvC
MSTLILGIDPGSRRTGFGLVRATQGQVRHLHHGIVQTFDENFPLRLKDIFDGVTAVIAEYRPDEAAVETVFLSKNPQSALKLGQARGAAICACVNAGLPVSEYAPRHIKNAVVGAGGADKTQVQYMVGILLTLQGQLQADAADALAVAIAHAHMRETAGRLGLPAKLFR